MDREVARRYVFDYIEMSYNPKRRHGYANRLSPLEFEKQYFTGSKVSRKARAIQISRMMMGACSGLRHN